MLTVNINGLDYPLAANLRVAYQVQGKNNHQPYTKVFSDIGDMPIEKQIEVIYVAFCVANPQAVSTMPWITFLNHYLDNSNASEIMKQLREIMEGILGKKLDDSDSETSDEASEGGNL